MTTEPQRTQAQVLLELMQGLAAQPNDIKMKTKDNGRTLTFTVNPSSRDYGRIIGSHGRTFKAFDLIAQLMSYNSGRDADLSVIQPKDGNAAREARFTPNPSWGAKQLRPYVEMVCESVFPGSKIDIEEPDQSSIHVTISVDESHAITYMYDGSTPTNFVYDRDADGVNQKVPITVEMIGEKLGTILKAICLNHGRKLKLYTESKTML